MATHDDDLIPEPDAEPTASERARARTFGDLVDKVLAGRAPAAMSADDRELIEVATVIRAAEGRVELPAARRAALVEQALRRAIAEPASPEQPSGATTTAVVPLDVARARRRWRGRAPWFVAAASTAVAAAAVLILLLRPTPRAPAAAAPELPVELRSRPADLLIGAIPRERADDAAARIDTIFADRLDGYRQLSLAGGR
jgi:hypothetical protein